MGKKDYSAGGGKKLLIAIGLIVLVAIIVVVVLLCIPPNTYNAVQTLNRATQSRFMSATDTKADFDNLQTKIARTENVATNLSQYDEELADIIIMTNSMGDVLDFYNNSIIFAQNNKNLKKNYKPIKNNLNAAKKSQDRLESILSGAREKAAGTDALKNAVIDFRREYINWLSCNQKAIEALNKAYTGSMGSSLVNNPAANTILGTVDQYIDVIVNDYRELDKLDKKGSSSSSYSYKFSDKIGCFENFVDCRLGSRYILGDIEKYYTNNNFEVFYKKINDFKTVYGENDFKNVINSVSLYTIHLGYKEYRFSYHKAGVNDTENVLDSVKSFLGGR